MHSYLKNRISRLVKELILMQGESELNCSSRLNDVLKFVLDQMHRMPWLPRFAIQMMTVLFGISIAARGGFIFGHPSGIAYKRQLEVWRRSSFRPCRDFVKFYTAMVVVSFYSEQRQSAIEAAR